MQQHLDKCMRTKELARYPARQWHPHQPVVAYAPVIDDDNDGNIDYHDDADALPLYDGDDDLGIMNCTDVTVDILNER